MENNSINQNEMCVSPTNATSTGVTAGAREVKTILYKPSFSIMILSDAELGKAITANMQSRFKGVAGVTVIRTNNANMPIKVKVTFLQNADIFERTLNPNLARLLNSDQEYKVTNEARALLEPFITSQTSLEVEQTHNRKGGNATLSINLHALKTLSSCLKIPEDTAIRIGEIAMTSKYNFVMEIENFPKQPARPPFRADNRNNNNRNNNRNNNGYKGNNNYSNRR